MYVYMHTSALSLGTRTSTIAATDAITSCKMEAIIVPRIANYHLYLAKRKRKRIKQLKYNGNCARDNKNKEEQVYICKWEIAFKGHSNYKIAFAYRCSRDIVKCKQLYKQQVWHTRTDNCRPATMVASQQNWSPRWNSETAILWATCRLQSHADVI